MKAAWCDRTLVESPFHFCLCVTEKQFHHEMERLKIPEDQRSEFTLGGRAATLHTFTGSKGDHIAVICVKPDPKRSVLQVHALLVHEAVHMWQDTKEFLGETAPSREFEAYAIQAMSQRLMYAYNDLTKKKKK